MFKLTRKHTALKIAFAAIAAGSSIGTTTPLLAQEVPAVDELIITGSRIARNPANATIPVLGLSQDSFTNQGFNNFADLAVTLPQFAPAFGESRTQSTFAGIASSGLNRSNLRNLTSYRTVVLINGRRVPGGTATETAVDWNFLPTANIDRIEIMTGGASAIYGADAVAGVINILTKQNFEGFEADFSYGRSTDQGDNQNPSTSLMWGGEFANGGHALVTLQYTKEGRVRCADRFLCAEDFGWFAPATVTRGPTGRSGVGEGGRFFAGANSYTTRSGSMVDAAGALIPFVTATDGYNRNAQRDIAIPTERKMLATDITYPLSDNLEIFSEINYGESRIEGSFEAHPFQSQQPGSLFGGGPGIAGLQATIPVNNPFVPPQLRAAVLAANPTATEITWWQRFSMIENRGADSVRDTTRVVAGLRGDFDSLGGFGSDWEWEASYVWGRTQEDLITRGLVGTDRLYHGLRVEPDPASPGNFRCADVTARAGGCVPINPMKGPGGYTQAMKDWLTVSGSSRGESILENGVAWLSGSVVELPAGPVNVAVGAEYRTFSGYRDHDNVLNALVTGNQVGDTAEIEIKTKEVYAETVVPLIKDATFARALDLEAAIRYSDTQNIDTYDTWKFGGVWEPLEGLRLRAMQATAVRSPVPDELSGISQTAGVVSDPCTAARRNANPTRASNCAKDGVPADYAPGQIIEQSVSGLTGGNPNLKPEQSETLTYGVVWIPSFVPNLTLTLDRFQIEMEDAITTVARQAATNFCYDTVDRQFCNVLTRGTNPLLPGATYVLQSVNEQQQNVAEYNIRGLDLQANYGFGLGRYGDLQTSLLWTIYDKAEQVQAGGTVLDLKGIAGGSTADQGYIKNTAVLNVGWSLDKYRLNWNTRYIGDADMGFGTTLGGFPRLASHAYHNLNATYELNDKSKIYGGVNNLGDKQPPFMASGSSGTQALDTVPGYYDVFGRSWYLGMTYGF
jgi:iron complex outermembrane recepter protein